MSFVNFLRALMYYARIAAEAAVVLKIVSVFVSILFYIVLTNWGNIGSFVLFIRNLLFS